MAAQRVVTGPVVVLPDGSGRIGYFYQGAVLPDGLDEERVQDAIASGLVSEDKDAAELTVDDLNAALAGDRLREAGRASESTTVDDEDDEDGPPPKAAKKDLWVDFAVAQEVERQGEDADEEQIRADAEALTKDELVAKYGA